MCYPCFRLATCPGWIGSSPLVTLIRISGGAWMDRVKCYMFSKAKRALDTIHCTNHIFLSKLSLISSKYVHWWLQQQYNTDLNANVESTDWRGMSSSIFCIQSVYITKRKDTTLIIITCKLSTWKLSKDLFFNFRSEHKIFKWHQQSSISDIWVHWN